MSTELQGYTVAILVADGFELHEMAELKEALEKSGARTAIVSLSPGKVRGWAHDQLGAAFTVDLSLDHARADDFDALLVTGMVLNPDALRHSVAAVRFIRGFFAAQKPVAAICQGLQCMLEADVMQDRTVTSFPSVRKDLICAGANWVDASVVVDHELVTSRSAADLDEFKARMLAVFAAAARNAARQESQPARRYSRRSRGDSEMGVGQATR